MIGPLARARGSGGGVEADAEAGGRTRCHDPAPSRPREHFSRTLESAPWNNTRLLKGDLAAEVRKLKAEAGPGMTILGSGTIVSQLTEARLIDEYQLVVNPLVLGRGRKLFDGVRERAALTLKSARPFRNGNVVLTYEPAR